MHAITSKPKIDYFFSCKTTLLHGIRVIQGFCTKQELQKAHELCEFELCEFWHSVNLYIL